MASKRLIYIIPLLLVLLACRKDRDVLDPAENYKQPCAYFPAHPGSWWTYKKSNSEQVKYEIDSVARFVNGNYLPYFKNLGCYIDGCNFYHSAYFGLGRSGYMRAPIIQIAFDSTETQSYSTVSFPHMSIVEFVSGIESIDAVRSLYTIDTTVITLSGVTYTEVLVIKESYISAKSHYYLEYFVKDIGMVKRDLVDYSDTLNVIETLTLEAYFISN